MPPSPPVTGSARPPVRPAAVVNAEIRALVESARGWLYGETRQRYEKLVVEWDAAKAAERCEVVEAA